MWWRSEREAKLTQLHCMLLCFTLHRYENVQQHMHAHTHTHAHTPIHIMYAYPAGENNNSTLRLVEQTRCVITAGAALIPDWPVRFHCARYLSFSRSIFLSSRSPILSVSHSQPLSLSPPDFISRSSLALSLSLCYLSCSRPFLSSLSLSLSLSLCRSFYLGRGSLLTRHYFSHITLLPTSPSPPPSLTPYSTS